MKNRFIVLVISFLFINQLIAQTPSKNAGTSSNIFLRAGLSTRASSLGEAFTAVADDENALFYNPAGLVNIKRGAIGLNHNQWFQDIRMDNLVFGYNFDRKMGVGISVSHLWMPSLQGKDNFGNPTGEIDVSSSIINLGIAYKIHPSLFLGVGLKYFKDNLAEFSADGVAIDAGLYMYTAITGLTFGISVQNLGGKIQYDTEDEKLPLTYRAGLAYRPMLSGLRLSFDAIKNIDNDFNFAAGIEYTLFETFSLRAGNQFRQDQNFTPGYGAGLNISNQYLIDYTFSDFKDLGSTHRVAFTFRFDLPGNSKKGYSGYKTHRITKSRPPGSVSTAIIGSKLKVSWRKIYGAVYNVYAKTSRTGTWKKLNKHLIRQNFLEFKKPDDNSEIYISVTSVVNSVESPFSKEVKINGN